MSVNYDESNRFLGMLAEVAVKTLNAEQQKYCNRNVRQIEDKPPKKSKNVLNVEQLRKLSDKVLVESFSEIIFDEIRRVFQFKCILMPQKCGLIFESVSREERSGLLMRDHLLDHIRNVEPNFTAEILSARSRRLSGFSRRTGFNEELTNDLETKSTLKSCHLSDVSLKPKIDSTQQYYIKQEIESEDNCLITTKDCVEDHCYTSLDGPKVKSKPSEKSGDNFSHKRKCLNASKVIATPAFPFIYEPVLPNISQVIEIGSSFQNSRKNYEKLGSDQTISDSVVEELNANTLQLKRLALQYINDIRVKNKGQTDKSSFRCKICTDKTFTSPTTLIYHYRSHAGVKPYECSLCKATFTRQHSLNYHTLIHLNKSRFVCDECGRNFRHPSHFKEHMRRHTGETPYECTDCYIKFKTRNTYKRHLQTKHAKMLTSKGIFDLPDSSIHLRKPCPPRRKYGLGFLHQNIEAVARYERAQQEVNQTIRTNCHLMDTIDSNLISINNCNKNYNSKNNFEKLLQAVAIAEDQQKTILLQ